MTGELSIVSESDFRLHQREYLKGDVVKRSLADLDSAVVIEVRTDCRLQHVVTGHQVGDWFPFEKLKSALLFEARDRVVIDNWIGTVDDVRSST